MLRVPGKTGVTLPMEAGGREGTRDLGNTRLREQRPPVRTAWGPNPSYRRLWGARCLSFRRAASRLPQQLTGHGRSAPWVIR